MSESPKKKPRGRPTFFNGARLTEHCNVILTPEQKTKLTALAAFDFGVPLSRFLLLAGLAVKMGLDEKNTEIIRLLERFDLKQLEPDDNRGDKVAQSYGKRSAKISQANRAYKRVKKDEWEKMNTAAAT